MNFKGQELIPLTEKDNQYEPPEDQIRDYAQYLGFTLPDDENLLYIAKQGLTADLPPDWEACTNKNGEIFYRNISIGVIQEEHPADQVYKEKFQRQKKRLQVLGSQKQIIAQQSESQLAGSDVYGLMKTSSSQRDQGKSHIMGSGVKVDDRNKSQMESVQSMNEQELQEISMGDNFYINESKTLQPQTQQINQLSKSLNDKFSTMIKQQFDKITVKPLKEKQQVYQSMRTQKVTNQMSILGNQIRQKQMVLDRLTKQRIQKQKELIKMEQQFQFQKQQIIDNYRERLQKKLNQEKRKKQKEFESTFKSIVQKQSKQIQKSLNYY